MIDLVELVRDVNPGQNTLLCIDEIVPIGLNILVFREGVPTKINNEGSVKDFNHEGFSVIDSKWIANYRLNGTDGDLQLKLAADKARYKLGNFKVNYEAPDYAQQERKKKKLASVAGKASAEYRCFRPSVISQRITQADLVVVPASLAAKIEAEIHGAKIAVLAERAEGSIQARIPATEPNYPRVLVRKWPSDLQDYGKPRVDETTLRLLMSSEPKEKDDFQYVLSRFDQKMDDLFYRALRRLNLPTTLYIERALALAKIPIFKYSETDKDIFDGNLGDFDMNSFAKRREEVTHFRPNGYGLGRSAHYAGFHAINLGESYERRKKEQIKNLYDSMWLTPLDSIDEVVERQNLIGELLANVDLSKRVQNLSRDFNRIYGLHLHLDGMSRNLTANLLHSKWGAKILQKPFYEDFTGLSREFTTTYESIAQNMNGINSNSRELQAMLEPLKHFMKEGKDMHAAYIFLKTVLAGNPSNYVQLAACFKQAIEEIGVKKIDDLEKYDKGVATKPTRLDADCGFEFLELFSQLEAGRLGKPMKQETAKERTLRGYKSPELQRLIDKFFDQIPIVRAKRAVSYMDYVGSKIAAYMAYADFMIHEGANWTKPEVISPELGVINIKSGWYPLTRIQHTQDFVRNDTYLDQSTRIEILDGANIGGKTTDLRKSLFIVLLALSGSYVPAEYARISFFDGLRYRIKKTGIGDSGAFAEELANIKSALGQFDGRCLYGFDETFTSTNDVEGEALTYGLIKRLALNPKIRAIFTSHYPSLHDILNDPIVSGVKFSHFTFDVRNGRLFFSHKKMEGPNRVGDYAIAIAEHEGISKHVIAHARNYSSGGA